MEQKIVIQKKKKTAAVIFASIFLLALSGLAVWVLIRFVYPELPGFLKLKIAATVAIAVVSLIAVFFMLKNTFSKKPGMIIDEHGLTDNTNLTSVGFIPWDEITAVKQTENSFRQKLFVITVKDPQKYIQKNSKLQASRKVQYTQFGSPIVITVNNLDYDANKLFSTISSKVMSS